MAGGAKQYFPQMPQGQKIKRFYKKVDIVEHPLSQETNKLAAGQKVDYKNLSVAGEKYWAVTLDGKVTKTMYKDSLLIPTKAMAVALAEEWESQKEHISLKSLHLVRPPFIDWFRTTSWLNASGRQTMTASKTT